MIRTKISAVTGVTYGLLSALVIVVALAALTAAGIGVENVFSIAGSTIANTMQQNTMQQIGTPNPNLNSEQQSEIANAAAEITAGTASAACLAAMNNDATNMANNNATCIGPGYSIAPPPSPIKTVFSQGYPVEVAQSGRVYMNGHEGSVNYGGNPATSTNTALWFYNDAYMDTGGYAWGSGGKDAGLYLNATQTYSSRTINVYKGVYNANSDADFSLTSYNFTNQSPANPIGFYMSGAW